MLHLCDKSAILKLKRWGIVNRIRKNKIPIGVRFLQGTLLVFLIMGIFTIVNLYFVAQTKKSQLEENQKTMQSLSKDIQKLESEISKSNSPEFVEKVAREDLGMVKPREVIFVDKNKEREDKEDKLNKGLNQEELK